MVRRKRRPLGHDERSECYSQPKRDDLCATYAQTHLHPMTKKQVHVPLSWATIDWNPEDTWGKITVPLLLEAGVRLGKH